MANDFKWEGLLGDPMMQMGLAILANNGASRTPNNFGQIVGKGTMQGLLTSNEFKQQQQENELRKQRAAIEQGQFEQNQEKFGQEKDQYGRLTKSISNIAATNPQFADLLNIDPKSAIKAIYPSANSSDPYYTPIATADGLGSFDNRSGKFALVDGVNGSPVVKSIDSPLVRGAVKDAEAEAAAKWKPNVSIDGKIYTDAQVARMANDGSIAGDYRGNPDSITADIMRIKDPVERKQAMAAYNAQKQGTGIPAGIKVPTKAEQAANVKTSELVAEDAAKTAIGMPDNVAQVRDTLGLVDQLVGSEDGKIKPHPGFESAVGMSSYNPLNKLAGTDAKDFNIRLDQLKGKQFMQAYQSLKGGGQITEVEGEKATDAISRMNSASSEGEFKRAARDFQSVLSSGLARSQAKVNGTPQSNNTTQQQRIKVYNPKTGRIE